MTAVLLGGVIVATLLVIPAVVLVIVRKHKDPIIRDPLTFCSRCGFPVPVAAVRWRVSKLTDVDDICRLLANGDISAGKAEEAIHSRISGNEPALPLWGEECE